MNRSTYPTSAAAASLILVAAAGALLALASPPPRLVDQCDRKDNPREWAPVIVSGVPVSDMRVARTATLQLRRITLKVEQVLQGGPVADSVPVYYYTWAGGFDGPRPLGFRGGGRRIFWLRSDSGVLRTACDGWDYCTEALESGAHPGYRPDPQRPADFAMVDLHLTRGEGPINENFFANEVLREETDRVPGLQEYEVEKMRRLAGTERGWIRANACLSLWIYSIDRVRPGVRQAAVEALAAVDCRCAEKPKYNMVCR